MEIKRTRNTGFEMDMLAVGDKSKSGDAILLRYGDLNAGGKMQKVVLIDGGYSSTASKIKDILKRYYKCRNSHGKYVIDFVFLTHTDLDHISGLVELANDNDIEIKCVFMHRPWEEVDKSKFSDGRFTDESLKRRLKDLFAKANELVEATPNAIHMPCTPESYKCELGAKFHILGPSDELYCDLVAQSEKTPKAADAVNERQLFSVTDNAEEENFIEGQEIDWDDNESTSLINETSLVLLFEYNGNRILFTGDSGKIGLYEAIEYAHYKNIDLENLDIIKMPHHGSRKNVNPEIMDNLGKSGTSCYISCVAGDEGHHPSKRLINLLNQKKFRVVTTSGSTVWRHHNAPLRNGYKSVVPVPYYKTMEKL